MKHQIINKRNRIIKEVWENFKSECSMEELADIFSIPLSTFYRILKENKKVGAKLNRTKQ